MAGKTHAHPTRFELGRNFFLLMVFMGITVFVAYFPVHAFSGPWNSFINNVIAMGIAVIKACLVIWFFMGVKYSSNLTKMYVVLGFGTFLLMFLSFIDYGTRRYEPVRGWEKQTPTALQRVRDNTPIENTGLGDPTP
ncbi:MAG: cytochrome C oxidase subunit IV family protein [Chthonomonas sp.]|nr:cytochrome C oxidase subunit IV family protein [Chthonomonas sp.]